MGFVQTVLDEKDQEMFNTVKDFLFQAEEISNDSTYQMVRYCIRYACSEILTKLNELHQKYSNETSPKVEAQQEKSDSRYVIAGTDFRPR